MTYSFKQATRNPGRYVQRAGVWRVPSCLGIPTVILQLVSKISCRTSQVKRFAVVGH